MNHFVAYHSVDKMQEELEDVTPFLFYSRKPINYLRKTLGNTVWAFSGKRNKKKGKNDFFLCSVFSPNNVEEDGDVNIVEGESGHTFTPKIMVNDFEWFGRLLKLQSNFSLGINEIKDESIIKELRSIYNNNTAANTIFLSPEELSEGEKIKEGKRKAVYVNIYERNVQARNVCIAHYGTTCMVCGFNFGKFYGAIGEGFIHVHHIVPLSEIGDEYELDPIKDLLVVCPNCHMMLHKGKKEGEILSVEQLKAILKRK